MNYVKIYNALIENARRKIRAKSKKLEDPYYENHHIVPVCLGGTNEKANRVLLTPKEHFVAHLLLGAIHKDVKSFFYTTFPNNSRKYTEMTERKRKRQVGSRLPLETRVKMTIASTGNGFYEAEFTSFSYNNKEFIKTTKKIKKYYEAR